MILAEPQCAVWAIVGAVFFGWWSTFITAFVDRRGFNGDVMRVAISQFVLDLAGALLSGLTLGGSGVLCILSWIWSLTFACRNFNVNRER